MEAVKHIALGCLFIIMGIGLILYTRKSESLKYASPLGHRYWQGYISGGAAIIGGILEMFGYWEW